MKKKYFLSLTVLTVLIFFAITAISAETDGIFDIWYNPQTGQTIFVSQYNHDNSVFKGPEYQAKIIELIEKGYLYKGYGISEYSGGSGPTHGSYEADFFVKSILTSNGFGDEWLLWKSSPNGLEYSTDEGVTWIPWDGTGTIELPIELEDIDINALFEHDQYGITGGHNETRYYWDWSWREGWHQHSYTIWVPEYGWVDMGDSAPTTTIQIINADGTQSTWIFEDDWLTIVDLIHSETTVTGEEIWETRTVVYELPQAGAGAPQLQPKNYGVQIIGTLYGPKSLDEIPPELLKFAKEINGQWYTYTGSELDQWIFENIYKPNHAKSYVEN